MGWVDLWHGILLCDVLETEPSLRAVPLPSPSVDKVWGIGDPVQRRGIAFVRGKGCLKFVHLEIADARLPGMGHETKAPSFRVDGWTLTTWSKNVMSDSLEDWHKECVVEASGITIDDMAISQFLEDSGLLRTSLSNQPKAEQRNLHNLSMYQPLPCLSGEDIVYLVAREKNRHPKAWILAVDMKSGGRLKGAAYFGIPSEYSGYSVVYRPSEISKIYESDQVHESGYCLS
ncbi:hypothetical protein HU200_043176 [Digitaria exilis]|uniref:DUF1618 domain-containing protein n=1 Tax=Digitaria exilis TaxID=1010633 RepID=A0A835ECJ9_9POAL|nr:hypothetical protein HU200_043176 [Digitaria exilis]